MVNENCECFQLKLTSISATFISPTQFLHFYFLIFLIFIFALVTPSQLLINTVEASQLQLRAQTQLQNQQKNAAMAFPKEGPYYAWINPYIEGPQPFVYDPCSRRNGESESQVQWSSD